MAMACTKWFLRESTSIYAPGDVQSLSWGGNEWTLADVLDDLYTVRNCIAHGDRVPDFLYQFKGGPESQAYFATTI